MIGEEGYRLFSRTTNLNRTGGNGVSESKNTAVSVLKTIKFIYLKEKYN